MQLVGDESDESPFDHAAELSNLSDQFFLVIHGETPDPKRGSRARYHYRRLAESGIHLYVVSEVTTSCTGGRGQDWPDAD